MSEGVHEPVATVAVRSLVLPHPRLHNCALLNVPTVRLSQFEQDVTMRFLTRDRLLVDFFPLDKVTKLVLENSLETRILEMQEQEAAYSALAKNGCVRVRPSLVCLRNNLGLTVRVGIWRGHKSRKYTRVSESRMCSVRLGLKHVWFSAY